MWRFLKFLFFLILVAVFAVIGYAYIGDLSPDRVEVNEPLELDGN